MLVSVKEVLYFSRKGDFCYCCLLSSFPTYFWITDDEVWWVILHWVKYTAIQTSCEWQLSSFLTWSYLHSTDFSTMLCLPLDSWTKFSLKSLGGTESVEKGPDFLHLAATIVFRVPQLTPINPRKCLRSWGSEGNEEQTIWKQQWSITLPWLSQYQVTRGHQEKYNRVGKMLLNATVQPFSKMNNSLQHGILVSASHSLGSL